MASVFDTTRNISLYTIPAAWVVSIIPHVYAISLYESATKKKFDSTAPRSMTSALKADQTIDAATKARIVRAEGAQQNGVENVGLFAAAVVAGNAAGLEASWLNGLSGAYVASRIVYNLIYINNESSAAANARTGVFFGGVGLIMTLFVSAGNKLRNSPLAL